MVSHITWDQEVNLPVVPARQCVCRARIPGRCAAGTPPGLLALCVPATGPARCTSPCPRPRAQGWVWVRSIRSIVPAPLACCHRHSQEYAHAEGAGAAAPQSLLCPHHPQGKGPVRVPTPRGPACSPSRPPPGRGPEPQRLL